MQHTRNGFIIKKSTELQGPWVFCCLSHFSLLSWTNFQYKEQPNKCLPFYTAKMMTMQQSYVQQWLTQLWYTYLWYNYFPFSNSAPYHSLVYHILPHVGFCKDIHSYYMLLLFASSQHWHYLVCGPNRMTTTVNRCRLSSQIDTSCWWSSKQIIWYN